MTFEPLIHVSLFIAILQSAMWAAIIALGIGMMTFLIMLPAKNKGDRYVGALTAFIMSFVFSLLCVGAATQGNLREKNEEILFSNLSQKYEVEEISFLPRISGFPEQSESQQIMVKANGKTRPAILTQNRDTSEPTLTDVDNGQPMDDILKK
jgi:hypothetical protein